MIKTKKTEKTTDAGRTQIKEFNITSAANAGSVVVATATTDDLIIDSIILRSNGATTADLTTAAIETGTGTEIIGADVALQAELNAEDKQVAAITKISLPLVKTIIIDLQGTGATAVDFNVIIEYKAITDGGTLS